MEDPIFDAIGASLFLPMEDEELLDEATLLRCNGRSKLAVPASMLKAKEIASFGQLFSKVSMALWGQLAVSNVKGGMQSDFPLLLRLLAVAPDKVMVGGGEVVKKLFSLPLEVQMPHDVDIFFHSVSPCEAEELLRRMLEIVVAAEPTARLQRSDRVVNAVVGPRVYQFVLRVFRSRSQILQSFDLSLCRVGFDLNRGVFATASGALSCRMKAVLADFRRFNNASSCGRLVKYYDRFFTVLFPGIRLRDELLVGGDACAILIVNGQMQLSVGDSNDARLHAIQSQSRTKEQVSDYGGIPVYDNASLTVHNHRRARDNDQTGFMFSAATPEELLDRPLILGGTAESIDRWFAHATFVRHDFVDFESNECYVDWDLEERMDAETSAAVLRSQEEKNAQQVTAIVAKWKALLVDRLEKVSLLEPLFDDVRNSPVVALPFQHNYLCVSPEELLAGSPFEYRSLCSWLPLGVQCAWWNIRVMYGLPAALWRAKFMPTLLTAFARRVILKALSLE